jgi:hypothetical protein
VRLDGQDEGRKEGNIMNTSLRFARLGLGFGLVVLSACVEGQVPAPAPGDTQEAAQAAAPQAGAIETWRRAIDRGGDAKAAKAALAPLAQDATLAPEVRDEARLVLAKAHAALGEKEASVKLLEDLAAAHANDRQWGLEEEADRLLSNLLTGKDPPKGFGGPTDSGKVSPFSRVLAKHLPLEEDASRKDALPTLHMDNLFFGGSDEVSAKLGTFNVRGAHIDIRRETCSLCSEGVRSDIHTSRSGSWLGIPRSRERYERALVVFYVDLEQNLIPERYADLLPMDRAELVKTLQEGKGVFAAMERDGAPPVLLIAAPRASLLADVEEALAGQTELPTEPFLVDLAENIRPQEIQRTVRQNFGSVKKCYEDLLGRSPKAEGKFQVAFAIEGGKALGVLERLAFPVAKGKTTVVYPIVVSP